MCELISPIYTKTKLIVVIHAHENSRPTNTGRLATQCLQHSELHVRGQIDVRNIDTSGFTSPDRHSVVLFPDESAVELNESYVNAQQKPITLIVPDGNWRQAKTIPKREAILKDLPRVKLPLGAMSEYRLRREPKQKPEGLATMEAIARAFRILEGEESYNHLMHVFRVKVARSLWARGKLRAEDASTLFPTSFGY